MTLLPRTLISLILFPCIILLGGCVGGTGPASKPWSGTIKRELGALGARNWVVIAESAFPIHSRRGLRVIQIDEEIPEIIEVVEQIIDQKQHVKPRVYVTSEVSNVSYGYAPGIENYRTKLKEALNGRKTVQLENAMLMNMMKNTEKTYRVLVIKTRTALPYSSVFMELGSGYWDSESESALRAKMEGAR